MVIKRNPDGTSSIDPISPTTPATKIPEQEVYIALVKGLQEALDTQGTDVRDTDVPPTYNRIPQFILDVFRVGDVISLSSIDPGVWTGDPIPTLQIEVYRAGVLVELPHTIPTNSLGLTYKIKVIGSNRIGYAISESVETTPVLDALSPPTNHTLPVITGITPIVGDIINFDKLNLGIWFGNPTPVLTPRLLMNGVEVSIPYTVVTADLGKRFQLEVTGENSEGTQTITSSLTNPVTNALVAPFVVSATVDNLNPDPGENITAVVSTTGNPVPTLAYQWFRMPGKITIGGATSATYTVTNGDIGYRLGYDVTPTNSQGTGPVFESTLSNPVPAPLTAPANTVLPTWVDSTPVIGDVITNASVNNGTWTGNPTPILSKQFKRNGANISVPYTIVNADAGVKFDCDITGTNSQGSVLASTAETDAVPNPVPPDTEENIVPKTTASGSNTLTVPTHAIGDTIIIFATNETNNTVPSVPAGWTTERSVQSPNMAGVMFSKIAQATNESIGTLSNCTQVAAIVYDGVVSIDAVNAVSSVGSTNIGYDAPSTAMKANSWLLFGAAHSQTDGMLENPPAGTVNRMVATGAGKIALHDTNGAVSSWTNKAVQIGGTLGNYITITAELVRGGTTTTPPPGPDPNPPTGAVDISQLTKRTTLLTVNQHNQTIRNVWFDVPGAAIHCDGFNGLVLENCLVDHRSGKGVYIKNCSNPTIRKVQVRKVNEAAGFHQGENSSYNNIELENVAGGLIEDVITEDGASGVYTNNARDVIVRRYETYRNRGPFPRGQGLQFTVGSHRCKAYNVYMHNPPGDSWVEDNFNIGNNSDDCEAYDFLIYGNNSPSGWGVLIELGSQNFRGFDIHTTHMYCGGSQDVQGGDPGGAIFTRHRDTLHQSTDNPRGHATSNFLKFGAIGAFGTQFLSCDHDGSGNNNISFNNARMKVRQITQINGLLARTKAQTVQVVLYKTPMVRP